MNDPDAVLRMLMEQQAQEPETDPRLRAMSRLRGYYSKYDQPADIATRPPPSGVPGGDLGDNKPLDYRSRQGLPDQEDSTENELADVSNQMGVPDEALQELYDDP